VRRRYDNAAGNAVLAALLDIDRVCVAGDGGGRSHRVMSVYGGMVAMFL
jgi:hypothetical protein